jgi:hypothetical protein
MHKKYSGGVGVGGGWRVINGHCIVKTYKVTSIITLSSAAPEALHLLGDGLFTLMYFEFPMKSLHEETQITHALSTL